MAEEESSLLTQGHHAASNTHTCFVSHVLLKSLKIWNLSFSKVDLVGFWITLCLYGFWVLWGKGNPKNWLSFGKKHIDLLYTFSHNIYLALCRNKMSSCNSPLFNWKKFWIHCKAIWHSFLWMFWWACCCGNMGKPNFILNSSWGFLTTLNKVSSKTAWGSDSQLRSSPEKWRH